MKKVLALLLLTFVTLTYTSCSKDEEVAKKYSLNITVKYPDGYSNDFLVKGINVSVKSATGTEKFSSKTDSKGVAKFSLDAGQYNISASKEQKDFAFNGNKENISVSKNINLELKLKAVALKGGLVFKEIYYTGSKTPKGGRYYSDQFHEIYNNSDETIYLDGLCIGVMQPTSARPSPWVDATGKLMKKLPLQFYVWYIPGNGKNHPLEARKSIVIAQDGINHKTDPKGNPNSPVNLGNADWETYCGDINGGKDADAPGVPNLKMMFTNSTTMFDWLHPVFGAGVIIFRLPKGTDPAKWGQDPKNQSTRPGSKSKRKYLMVPTEYVIDAVEAVRAEENKRHKRIPDELDAGKVWCSGTYVSESIRRKVKQIIDGKVIYQDTNNSSNDFLGSQTPTPGIHPKKIDK